MKRKSVFLHSLNDIILVENTFFYEFFSNLDTFPQTDKMSGNRESFFTILNI